jgi:hypothetical protein
MTIVLVILVLIFFIGAGISITGLALWELFDINIGETLAKIGICLMIFPIVAGIIAGAVILLLALFGVVFFI